MKRTPWIGVVAALLLTAPSRAWATAETDLASAGAAGQAVFLVVTEANARGVDDARRLAGEAQRLATRAAVVEVDRGDATNQALVRRYRLGSVSTPLILVIAPNGVAAGGARPGAVTAERLVAMIPSPAKAAMLKSIDDRKATFLVFWRASMADRAAALQAAHDAVTALKGAATVVSIDFDAATEAGFIAEMKVDVKSAVPIVGAYNAKGQPTETFLGVPGVAALVAAAGKAAQSPCCPGGRCGPGGCK